MARPIPKLLAISDRRALGARRFEDWLDELERHAVDGLQVRAKELSDRALLELARGARRRLPAATVVAVNGRVDVALAAGCRAVHLPSNGVPIAPLRRLFGGRLLIGRSTHRPEEVARARDDGADYALFGPVFATPGKEAYGPPAGLDGLARAAACGLPVLALGGVGPGEVAAVAATGAAGVAGIRAFHDAVALGRLAAAARHWPAARAGGR